MVHPAFIFEIKCTSFKGASKVNKQHERWKQISKLLWSYFLLYNDPFEIKINDQAIKTES